MLALFNAYDDRTKELMRSLHIAGVADTAVIVHYDGELPDGALCPFVTYTGLERTGAPLFFNEVPVPQWCEIRQGKEPYGEILRDGFVIGRINYDPSSFRQVESVDWVLRDGSLSHSDHYDHYGNQYATSYYSDGVLFQTLYRRAGELAGRRAGSGRIEPNTAVPGLSGSVSAESGSMRFDQWEIEVNHVSKAVVMRSARSQLTFETLTDFVSYFIDDQHLPTDRLLINSLSYPLFVARKRAIGPNTILFWQEPMPGDVPDNMATELERPRALTRIVFSDEALRQKVAEQYPRTAVSMSYLSQLGQFAERGYYDPRRTFTLTHSDDIPALEELLEAFPNVTFSVAALTLMSDKLHELSRRHPNLTLTPSITHKGIREELERASVYLDINAGGHVLEVVKAAYYLNLVVLASAAQAKAPDYELVFSTTESLKTQLSTSLEDPRRAVALGTLHQLHGPISTPDDYQRLLV